MRSKPAPAILAVLLLAGLAAAQGLWTYVGGGYFVRFDNWTIYGSGGASLVVPNSVELWAKRIVIYISGLSTSSEKMIVSPNPRMLPPGAIGFPIYQIFFTVRVGTEPVAKYVPNRTATLYVPTENGSLVGRPTELYTAEPAGGKVYLIHIFISDMQLIASVHNMTANMIGTLPPLPICDLTGKCYNNTFYAINYTTNTVILEADALPNGTLVVKIRTDSGNYSFAVHLGGEPWIWIGPEYPSAVAVVDAGITYFSMQFYHVFLFYPSEYYVWDLNVVYNGSSAVAVFLGNGTLSAPPVAYPYMAGVGARVEAVNYTFYALPTNATSGFDAPAKPLWDLRNKTADICYDNGTCLTVPAVTLVPVPPGYEVTGDYVQTPLGPAAVGTVYVHKPNYMIAVVLPNGTTSFTVPWNSTFTYTPPDVYLPNGTAFLDGISISVKVMYNVTVTAQYRVRLYHVVLETPFGVNETWIRAGSTFKYKGADVVLDNGTRVVVYPISVVVEKPLFLAANYTIYYNVTVETPLGANYTWVERGSTFKYKGADVVLDNGTRIVIQPASAIVKSPVVLKPSYTVYYNVTVVAPNGTFSTWVERGSSFSYGPPVVYFNNGTRLIGVKPCSVVATGPTTCSVEYSTRQYYVVVREINGTWEGWADEGSEIGTNVTANGVSYIARPIVVRRPGNYTVYYTAVYEGVARDVLGVPDPAATIELCNATARPGWDGSFRVEAVTADLCTPKVSAFPLSPYVIVVVGIVVAVAAVAVIKRRIKH